MTDIVTEFHKLYYGKRYEELWGRTFYRGVHCLKCVLDLWIYQEIFFDYKPELVIECGTFNGGSALWIRDTLNNLGMKDTHFVTIDIDSGAIALRQDDIEYYTGSSIDQDTFEYMSKLAEGKKTIVILDSCHEKNHVLTEMKLYSQLIKSGGYLIVEDTNLNGHPVRLDWGPGPFEAIEEFMRGNNDFIQDRDREKFLISFNINGYLKRK